MSAISVLHAPRDQALGRKIAEALARLGHDARPVSGEEAQTALADDASIVIWSNAALRLARLHNQAKEAFARGALIPVAVGGASAPNGFEDLPPVDLSGWGGDEKDPRWRFVLEEIAIAAERQQREGGDMWVKVSAPPAGQETAETGWPRLRFALAGGAGLVAVGVLAMMMTSRFFAAPDEASNEVAESAPPPVAELAVLQALPVKAPAEEAPAPIEAIDIGPSSDFEITVTRSGEVVPGPAEPAVSDEGVLAQGAVSASLDAAAGAPDTEDDAMAALVASVTTPASAEVFRDCDACPDMARLPAGAFQMGAPASEPARQPTEGPVRDIAIASPFAMGVHEVTFEEWAACVEGGGCRAYQPYDHGWGRGARPVVNVSYEDAQDYVAWLSKKTGATYRLPTEAEWEYAARAGSAAPFATGVAITTDQANFNGEYPYIGDAGTFRKRTTPAASFAPNAFGLYDMNGNVWEWTADCWRETHASAPEDGSAIGGSCAHRVLKGGAWNTGGWRLRAGHRIGKEATSREFDNGFRVVRDLDS